MKVNNGVLRIDFVKPLKGFSHYIRNTVKPVLLEDLSILTIGSNRSTDVIFDVNKPGGVLEANNRLSNIWNFTDAQRSVTFSFAENAVICTFKNVELFLVIYDKVKILIKDLLKEEDIQIARLGYRKIYSIVDNQEIFDKIDFNDNVFNSFNDKASNSLLKREFYFETYRFICSIYYKNIFYPSIYANKNELILDMDGSSTILIDDEEDLSGIFHSISRFFNQVIDNLEQD